MSAQGFILGMNETSKLNAERGATVRVRSGHVPLTRRHDSKDHILNAGDAVPLGGGGAAMITTYQPTLLDLYRQDPVALREQITRRAHRTRNEDIGAFFARFFC
jgi:hypothetical protein